MQNLLNSSELAEKLGCTRLHVYELVKKGLPHKRLGPGPKAPYRFSEEAVMRWLDRFSGGTVTAKETPQDTTTYEPTYIT